MLETNKDYSIHVASAKHAVAAMLSKNKIKDLYFSKHFFERAVERNLETKLESLFHMACKALADMRSHTYSDYRYKVFSNRSIYLAAKVEVGVVTGNRRLVVQTCYDIDVFDAKHYDCCLKFC